MISVIIPCYNIAHHLNRTLDSVLAQSGGDWEIVAVDDGSIDETGKILDDYAMKYSNVRVYHQENKGVASARNRGVEMAQGEWIYFLDGDDIILPFFFEEIKVLLDNSLDLLLFGFNCIDNDKIISYIPKSSDSYLRDFLLYVIPIHISSLIVNKKLLERNGIKFNVESHIGEDREFIYRLLLNSGRIEVCKQIYFNYFIYPTSSSHRPIYTERTFTAITTFERIYNELKDTKFEKYALIQLKSIIVIHQIYISNWECEDNEVKLKLKNKASVYLQKYNPWLQQKISWYTNLASITHKNKVCHKLLLNVLRLLRLG